MKILEINTQIEIKIINIILAVNVNSVCCFLISEISSDRKTSNGTSKKLLISTKFSISGLVRPFSQFEIVYLETNSIDESST